MKKSIKLFIIVAVIILILVFILLALIGLKNNRPSVSKTNNSQEQTEKVINVDDAVKKISKKYKENASFQKCVVRSLDMCLGDSIKKELKNNAGIELCDDYITDDMKDSCKTNFVFNKAIKSGNISDCNVIKNDKRKSSCMLDVAYTNAIKNNSLDACQNLEESLKKKCINKSVIRIARNLKDVSWCDKMEDEKIQKDICIRDIENEIEREKLRNQKMSESKKEKETKKEEEIKDKSIDKEKK